METHMQSKKILVSNSFVLRMHNYMRAMDNCHIALAYTYNRHLLSKTLTDPIKHSVSASLGMSFFVHSVLHISYFKAVHTRTFSPSSSFPTLKVHKHEIILNFFLTKIKSLYSLGKFSTKISLLFLRFSPEFRSSNIVAVTEYSTYPTLKRFTRGLSLPLVPFQP